MVVAAVLLVFPFQPTPRADTPITSSLGALIPLSEPPPQNEREVALGRRLFHDPALSGNKRLSCSSCHDLDEGGDDNKTFSSDTRGLPRALNTPTVFNALHNFVLGQRGNRIPIAEFFAVNLFSERVMDNTLPDVASELGKDPSYVEHFAEIYPDGVTPGSVVQALIAFQRSLVTPDSRFDQYLRGDATALDEHEKRGYELFQTYGCIACHQGMNIGGNLYQRFMVFGDYYADIGKEPNPVDLGRYGITRREQDRFVFRVPSLRNVAVTAPYLHDGSATTLDDVIAIMGRYQLGRDIVPEDRSYIAAFLRSLTGKYDGQYLDER